MRKLIILGLAVVGLAGCDNTTPPAPAEVMTIGWLRGDFGNLTDDVRADPMWSEVIAVAWNGSIREALWDEAVSYFVEHAHVVSLTDGAPVLGEMRRGFYRVTGEYLGEGPFLGAIRGASFVPDQTLRDGWYVAVVDLRDWLAAHRDLFPFPGDTRHLGPYSEEGFVYVRFQVGDAPTWVSTVVNNGEFGGERLCYVLPWITPNVRLEMNPFELRVEGETPGTCSATLNEDGRWMWRCPFLSDDSRIVIETMSAELALRSVTTQTIVIGELELGGGDAPTAEFPGRGGTVPVEVRAGIDVARSAL